ncbi:MAG: hypothetical protein L0G59_04955 [Kocuria sp.]|nr:hypothetical protein [Kocuria sp.]
MAIRAFGSHGPEIEDIRTSSVPPEISCIIVRGVVVVMANLPRFWTEERLGDEAVDVLVLAVNCDSQVPRFIADKWRQDLPLRARYSPKTRYAVCGVVDR